MDKYTWYVIVTKDSNGKYDATAVRFHNTENLLNMIEAFNGTTFKVESINACDTKKSAQDHAIFWNNQYRINGKYRWA